MKINENKNYNCLKKWVSGLDLNVCGCSTCLKSSGREFHSVGAVSDQVQCLQCDTISDLLLSKLQKKNQQNERVRLHNFYKDFDSARIR